MYCALTIPHLIKQAFVYDYVLKASKIIHAALESLNNQNLMLKIASESSTKRGRITDDKNSFVLSNFVIITCTLTSSIFNHTKHIDLPRSSKYKLFNKGNGKR